MIKAVVFGLRHASISSLMQCYVYLCFQSGDLCSCGALWMYNILCGNCLVPYINFHSFILSSCFPDDPISQGTELNWTLSRSYIQRNAWTDTEVTVTASGHTHSRRDAWTDAEVVTSSGYHTDDTKCTDYNTSCVTSAVAWHSSPLTKPQTTQPVLRDKQ